MIRQPIRRRFRRSRTGFSLLELLAAMTIFVIMMSILVVVTGSVQKAWIQGDQRVEISQSGRAALELMARELSQAHVSRSMQFVQSPDLADKIPNQAPNSPSLFWMAPGPSTDDGNLYEVGYYLTRDEANQTYQLCRFYVAPDNNQKYYLGDKAYWLETSGALRDHSFANQALWLTKISNEAFDPNSPERAIAVAADGVVALWIRCLDVSGEAIPWLFDQPTYSTETIQFNSGASFTMAARDTPFDDGSTFRYGAGPSPTSGTPTVPANRLPTSVEIVMIVVDTRSLMRGATVPPMPAATTPQEIPAQIEAYQNQLLDAGIQTARTFTIRVPLVNAFF